VTTNTNYVDLASFRSYVGLASDTSHDTQLTLASAAASRAIDSYCRRHFYQDSVATARVFIPQTLLDLRMDQYAQGGDISSRTNLTVVTNPAGNGNFLTAPDAVTWASTDFELLPENNDVAFAEPRPWTALRAVGTKTFPWLVNTWLTHLHRVQITALWGWVQVPDAVTEAAYIKSARLFFRKDSPSGIAGVTDYGPVRISRAADPDIVELLTDYRRVPVLVG
jgi:hypothetical protein